MAEPKEFSTAPQPYPARPHWTGDFHQLEASLFSAADATERAADFASAFVPRRAKTLRPARSPLTDRYVLVQLPDMPSVRIDVSDL